MWIFLAAGFLVFLAFAGYSLLRGYHLWLRNRIPNALYIVLQALLLGALFVCHCGIPLPGEVFREILQIISAVYLSVLLCLPVLCFFRGIIRFVGKRRGKNGRIYRFFNHPARSLYVFLGITACIGIFSLFRMRYVQVREYSATVQKEAGVKECNIAVLADLHLGTGVTRWGLDSLIEKVNAEKPDIVVLLGDIFDENTTEELKRDAVERMKELSAGQGIFYVDGNHENRLREDVASLLESAGIVVLRDQVVRLTDGVQLVGVRDETDSEKIDPSHWLGNLDADSPIIVLSHRPSHLSEMEKMGVDAVLCAHTHGGRYPFSWIMLPFFNDMIYGEKKYGAMSAITTSGAGGYGIPAKLTAPSEIACLRLSFQ